MFTSHNSRVTFGPGTGAIIFEEVDCDGTEVSLRVSTCLSRFSRPEYCHHNSDTGVRCDRIGSSGEYCIVLQLIILMQWCSNNGLSLISTMSVNNPNF